MESDSDEEEDEEVVGMEQRPTCLLDKVYTGNLQVSNTWFILVLN